MSQHPYYSSVVKVVMKNGYEIAVGKSQMSKIKYKTLA
jgi:hypothetical protein